MSMQKQIWFSLLLAMLLLFGLSGLSAHAAQIGPQLQSVLQEMSAGEQV